MNPCRMAVHLIFPSTLNLIANVNLFHSSLRPALLVCFLALAATQLHGQVEVSVPTAPRVGVSISGPLGGGVTEIVSNDLKRTGMISPVGGGSGDYLASGDASESGVTGRLVNKKTGADVFSQTFTGKGRLAAHQFADAITEAVTGLPGFASSKLAFIANPSSSKELYLADMDGFNARAITHDGTISASPALNHDGTKLAYTSYKSGYPDVYLIDLASGSRTRVAFFPGINTGPSFSPDGSLIALTLSKDGNPEIYTMSLDGGIADPHHPHPGIGDISLVVANGRPPGLFLGRSRQPAAFHQQFIGGFRHGPSRHGQFVLHQARLVAGRQIDRLHRARRRPIPNRRL